MKRVLLTVVLALVAILAANEGSRSSQIGNSGAAVLFENGLKRENDLLCTLIPPVRWPDPLPPIKSGVTDGVV